MINIWNKKKEKVAGGDNRKPKTSAATIRVQKDLGDLELPKTMEMTFPNPEDILNFELTIAPDDGYYRCGKFQFSFKINANYPHEPPKVLCLNKIYHPNIDLSGNVCLNVLREDWKPVLNLNTVIVGLQFLFLEPNPDDPLNKDAARDLRADPTKFASTVRHTLRGGTHNGEEFDSVTY
ncbi:NEDD8-conjugating enzyme UBC12 [Neoconidiobolus thromboides FSU 785]|nr:NEDD8-conjugating enzyme UBC12 [Neoconidiobolus thromboides FSU 785]